MATLRVASEGGAAMDTAFVTGGSGYLGRNLIRRLRAEGVRVRALARSADAAAVVQRLGAEAVAGDLDDTAAMTAGMEGCEVVFHAAACVEEWGPPQHFYRLNVEGTGHALDAAEAAAVGCFVHVGTEAIFAAGRRSMAALDDSTPIPERPLPRYPATKAAAEKLVRARNRSGFRCLAVRPRLIWGRDDTSVMPAIVQAVRDGRYMWLDGGHYLTSTAHVDNVCEGLWLAALKGRGGEAYFITDGEPVEMRVFLTRLLATQGVDPGTRSLPRGVAMAAARACEFLWWLLPLPGGPPVHRMAICLFGSQVVCSDARARAELGYREIVSIDEGLRTVERPAPAASPGAV